MEKEAMEFAKRCVTCQKHANSIHAPAVALKSLTTPWPFHTWSMDLMGALNPSKGKIWILAATELFTKWVEAIPLRRATGESIASFVKEYIICRFGIPKVILSDNGNPFTSKPVRELYFKYGITQHKSTVYYPKGNGQAEVSNKTLSKTLSKTMSDFL